MNQFKKNSDQISEILKADLSPKKDKTNNMLERLLSALPQNAEHSVKEKILARQLTKAMDNTHKAVKGIQQKVAEQQKREKLNELFPNLIMIMFIGKVNCGKSTLGEYLAKLLSKHFAVQWFEIDDAGKKISAKAGFETDSIECTRALKGFVAGPFVFIDTPGLHSMTQKNGDLTKRFVQSADIILCCTASIAPGKEEEMDYFAASIRAQTPYLPVITQSDKNVAQLNTDGKLVEVLELKPKEDRLTQVEHVRLSLTERLPDHNVLTPLPVSVWMAQKGDNNIELLLGSIIDISLTQVIEHKVEKNLRDQQNLLKITQQMVEQEVGAEVAKALQQTSRLVEKIQQDLEGTKAQLKRNFHPVLWQKINQYKAGCDSSGLAQDLSSELVAQWQVDAAAVITKNFEAADALCSVLQASNVDLGEFSPVTREIRISNNTGKLVGAGLGLLGFIAGPAVGLLASSAGGLIGGYFDEDDVFDEVIGVDTRQVETKAEQWLETSLNVYCEQLMSQVEESLSSVIQMLTLQDECIHVFNQQVNAMAHDADLKSA